MGMVLMRSGMGGCCLFCFLWRCVMHPMAVVAMVMVHLGDCDLRAQGREHSQGKGKTSHWRKQLLRKSRKLKPGLSLDPWI